MIFKKKIYIKDMDVKQNRTRRILALIAPLAIGFSLCACGTEVAGGGPSGTEAGNAITAQILIADAPAANARVKLVEQASLDGQGYIATANDEGVVTIENVAIGNYTMEASLNGTSLQLPVNVNETKVFDLGKQTLQRAVYIGGNVSDFIKDSISESEKNMSGFVKFRGLDHSAAIINGKFEVFGLPAGKLDMVFIPNGTKHDTLDVPIKVAAGDSLTTLKPKTQPKDTTKKDTVQKNMTLLVEDFEDGDNHNLLASEYTIGGYGGMWSLTSNPNFMFFNITPELTPQTALNPFLALIQDDGNGGKEVHFTVGFPDTALYKQQWVCFGMNIGNIGWSYDLSSVDSIAFDAWGKGSGEIQISDDNRKVTDTSSPIPVYTAGKFPIELSEKKKTYKLALTDILPYEADRKSITTLALVFHADVELHFDNLKFIGKNLLDIWTQQQQ
ncbi:MAG: carboxypeptidase regulatory-like domain-containing protein [Fibrobacter sp.]|nr:carboxypeptidase regulatory-like domain-containing protein [Fibrobacter sp.]